MISVKNLSGFVSLNADGSWNCESGGKHKIERLPDPVSQCVNFISLLDDFTIFLQV